MAETWPIPNFNITYGAGLPGSPIPATTPSTTQPTSTQQDAIAYLRGLLNEYGLGSEADWAWDMIRQGRTAEYVLQELRKRDAYKARFKGMEARRQAGLPAISEQEYIAYERNAYQMMRTAGMPRGFYDNPDDFATLIGNDVSVAELSRRIANGYQRIADAPPEVMQAFSDLFGVNGEQALAALILDPDKALPLLEQQITAGVAVGVGRIFGFGISTNTAQRMGQFGLSDEQIYAGYERMLQLRPLLTETVSEGTDLNADTGAAAVFGIDGTSMEKFQQRQKERLARNAGVGDILVNQRGLALGAGGQNG